MEEQERGVRSRISLELRSDPRTVPLCRHVLRAFLSDLVIDESWLDDIELAVSEAAGNVVRHAYDCSDHPYQVTLTSFADRVCLEVVDQGAGFNRADVPVPGTHELGGRGLWLIEQIADSTLISTLPGGGCRLAAEFRFPHSTSLPPAAHAVATAA